MHGQTIQTKVWLENPEGRPMCRWKDNIKINALVNVAMNLWIK
jgi:hypothetical protein